MVGGQTSFIPIKVNIAGVYVYHLRYFYFTVPIYYQSVNTEYNSF